MNVELGKLEVNSIDSDDNGDYECALPNGKKYKYRISVIDLPSISLFETRTNLKKSSVFYVNEPNEIVELYQARGPLKIDMWHSLEIQIKSLNFNQFRVNLYLEFKTKCIQFQLPKYNYFHFM